MHINGNGYDDNVALGEPSNGIAVCREIGKPLHDTISATVTSQTNPPSISHFPTRNKQRGMIYFRPIQPCDRSIIQTLHEEWFPVDYKADFFDTLCSERKIMPGGALGAQPLYCVVACFRELSDEEYEERDRRRREREGRRESGGNGSRWSSFWSRTKNDDIDIENDEEDEDYLLYELDDSQDDDSFPRDNNGSDKERSYQESTSISDGSIQSQQSSETAPINGAKSTDKEGEDAIESGESVFSIHHCRERERMRRFYSNGFRFDSFDRDSATCNHHSNTGDRERQTQQQKIVARDKSSNTSNNKHTSNEEGPYYNDNGERIIGCIVGSFLPSTLPASKHRSTLDEKIGRDETATLLIPDSTTYTKMFYIMTLGTTREFRRCGLGSVLVNRVVDTIEQKEEECGALYLHVITYNDGAIRLYERLGFMRVKEIKGKLGRETIIYIVCAFCRVWKYSNLLYNHCSSYILCFLF